VAPAGLPQQINLPGERYGLAVTGAKVGADTGGLILFKRALSS